MPMMMLNIRLRQCADIVVVTNYGICPFLSIVYQRPTKGSVRQNVSAHTHTKPDVDDVMSSIIKCACLVGT
jgi:hypothetical protein